MNSDRTLVNFRVPDELIDVFDQSYDYRNVNMIQTLIGLMMRYDEIVLQDSLSRLKIVEKYNLSLRQTEH
jgi:hypothetical protein